MIVSPPVRPYRGLRGQDAYGSGTFGASRDGGARQHLGRDYVALPGDDVLSPIDGRVKRVVVAYAGSGLLGLEIQGATALVKMLYFEPEVHVGATVQAGQKIGIAQDVAAWYAERNPGKGPMTNHVHAELMVWVDMDDLTEHPDRPVAA